MATFVRQRRGRIGRLWPYYLVLAALAVFSLGPMLVLGFNSVKSNPEIGANPLGPPTSAQWSNFTDAWTQGNIGQGLINTAILTAGTIVGIWATAGLAAYVLARVRLPGSGTIVFYLLLTTALPVQMFLVPLFFLWSRLGLYDTLLGLIIIHIALNGPFSTLLLRAYFGSLPKDFEEAARLDGAGELAVLLRVVIPLAWPGFLTVGLIAGLWAYNDLFFATIFIQTDDRMPVSTAFLAFQSQFSRDWGLTSAAGVLIGVPVILLFLAMQKRFIEGLTVGGLQG